MSILNDHAIRRDAREVAADVLEWQATAEEWAAIAQLVTAAIEAWDAQDWPALERATVALELASPLRATRMGDERRVKSSISEPVRERVNRLVHGPEDDIPPTEPERPEQAR
ncbi:CATRA system-associated protein [Kibdelosporangium aridum]|uniref:CATRA-Associated Small Protein domain-containing protein n=1 Tax=Kibdelosporangium aridum TaxID=2030 RepID=A0A1Y5Y9L2_KIBAR|nr:CATRA system-associated protein [Kibdelosporangium aridum]SMD27477.1 hypothetical protein SAMN05661093_11084 [Kibdelosporangium aridum]